MSKGNDIESIRAALLEAGGFQIHKDRLPGVVRDRQGLIYNPVKLAELGRSHTISAAYAISMLEKLPDFMSDGPPPTVGEPSLTIIRSIHQIPDAEENALKRVEYLKSEGVGVEAEWDGAKSSYIRVKAWVNEDCRAPVWRILDKLFDEFEEPDLTAHSTFRAPNTPGRATILPGLREFVELAMEDGISPVEMAGSLAIVQAELIQQRHGG